MEPINGCKIVACGTCGTSLYAPETHTGVATCGVCMAARVKARERKASTGINAAAWFYGQSFNGVR